MKTMKYIKFLLVGLLGSSLLVSCDESNDLVFATTQVPTITSFEPATGALGDEIAVYGTDLSAVVSASIGSGSTTIKYRVDATMLVLEVTSESRDGSITLTNSAGTATSSSSFDVDHTLVPTMTEMIIPTQTDSPSEDIGAANYAASGAHVTVLGSDLNGVSAVEMVSSAFGTTEATIIYQSPSELVFEVPLLDYSVTTALSLSYYNGSAQASTSLDDFYVLVLVPTGYDDYVPSSLTKYSPFTMEGFNMDMFNSFYVESSDGEIVNLTIKTQTTTSISIDISSTFYQDEFTGDLIAIYNTDKELTLAEDFILYGNAYEHRYLSKSGMYIDCRSQLDGANADSFLDLSDMNVYGACAVESGDLLPYIDVVPYHKGLAYLQVRTPSSMSSTLKNFKCDDSGNSATSWNNYNDFYNKVTYYYGLDSDGDTYPAHKTFLDAFADGKSAEDATGVAELTEEYFTSLGITFDPTDLTTGTYYGVSIYESGTYSAYPGLNYASPEYPYIIVYSVDDDKYGLIKVESTSNNGVDYMVGFTFTLFY